MVIGCGFLPPPNNKYSVVYFFFFFAVITSCTYLTRASVEHYVCASEAPKWDDVDCNTTSAAGGITESACLGKYFGNEPSRFVLFFCPSRSGIFCWKHTSGLICDLWTFSLAYLAQIHTNKWHVGPDIHASTSHLFHLILAIGSVIQAYELLFEYKIKSRLHCLPQTCLKSYYFQTCHLHLSLCDIYEIVN